MRLRLIDVDTCQFARAAQLSEEEKVLADGGPLRYGILSHRWLDDADEVKYDELPQQAVARDKKGYLKVVRTCELAKRDGLRFVWLDTCCIDKSSSAELQESINSMYQWYEESAECYVHLKDTDLDLMPPSNMDIGHDEWFERAWTLQELVAPKTIKFYDKNWRYIGDKQGLKQQIHERTGISMSLLENEACLDDFSIAERMSWAAGRKGAVVEDRAYSLFGLFNVNLPMLYGERENAFLRLQEEIIKTSDDHSIFAWVSVGEHHGGLLATTPEDFAGCRHVKAVRTRKGRSAYRLTNRGVEITLHLTPWTLDTYLARIHCIDLASVPSSVSTEGNMSAIFLRRLDEDDQYARVKVDGEKIQNNVRPAMSWGRPGRDSLSRDVPVYVRQPKATTRDLAATQTFGYRICSTLLERNSKGESMFQFRGPSGLVWDEATRMITIPNGSRCLSHVATLDISSQGKKIKQIKFCFDFDFNPVVFLAASGAIETLAIAMGKGEWQIAPEELSGNKGLADRTADDKLGWSSIGWVRNKRVAVECAYRRGLWALKGDRVDGLDVFLLADTKLRLQKVKTDYGLVWEFQIDNIPFVGLRKVLSYLK